MPKIRERIPSKTPPLIILPSRLLQHMEPMHAIPRMQRHNRAIDLTILEPTAADAECRDEMLQQGRGFS